MAIRNKQIEDAPKRQPASGSDPDVQTGEGAWYTKLVSGAVEGWYKDDQGNAIQMTEGGAIKAPVSSVNGQTGATSLDADDIEPTASRIWFTSAEQTKLGSVDTGAQVNYSQVSAPEITAGTETSLRSFSPADVKDMIDTHSVGGGAVDSVNGQTGTVVLNADDIDDTSTTNKFTTAADISKLADITVKTAYISIPNAGSLSARLAAATGLPVGWSLVVGNDGSADANFSGTSSDVVLIHNQAKPISFKVFKDFGGITRQEEIFDPSSLETLQNNSYNQLLLKTFETKVGSPTAHVIVFVP